VTEVHFFTTTRDAPVRPKRHLPPGADPRCRCAW
jgi:hypothetical protein